MSLVGLLLTLLVVVIAVWLIAIAPFEPRLRMILQVVVVVIVLLWLLGTLLGSTSIRLV